MPTRSHDFIVKKNVKNDVFSLILCYNIKGYKGDLYEKISNL